MAKFPGASKAATETEDPPKPGEGTSNLDGPPRNHENEAKVSMDFKVPESVQIEFSREAGEVIGFKKGAKSLFFLEIWNHWKATKGS